MAQPSLNPEALPERPIRIVTATALFDGHDVSINLMRRLLQQFGAEIIHLGHDRSVLDLVQTALQEDADAICVSSYQGGHNEYFRYLIQVLQEADASHIRVFGGGGGVITPPEIEALHEAGVAHIFSPEDGRKLGLEGMIEALIADIRKHRRTITAPQLAPTDFESLAQYLTWSEQQNFESTSESDSPIPVLGITGTGGAGKSTLTDELVRRFCLHFPEMKLAVLSIDPTKKSTGGALLGDRIRMNSLYVEAFSARVFMRSFATRSAHRAVSATLKNAIQACQKADFNLILVETAGIGQSDTEIADLADLSVYVMTQDFGAPTQLEKIGMLDVADVVVLNKFEKKGSEDALRDVRKQVQRNRKAFQLSPEEMPVFPTRAAQFNDVGVNHLFLHLLQLLKEKGNVFESFNPKTQTEVAVSNPIIPTHRSRYLSEIAETVRKYHQNAEIQLEIAQKWQSAKEAQQQLAHWNPPDAASALTLLTEMEQHWWGRLQPSAQHILSNWEALKSAYSGENYTYEVRGKAHHVPLFQESLSGLKIPRIALPQTISAREQLKFALMENLPGFFPFTAGVFPFKRQNEAPTRMFAGEGNPERTNKRFHLLADGQTAKRLSTAFDSVTLYGRNPDLRPDIWGKVGNAGVSVCTLDCMKALYDAFDLCSPSTSVSMTINGPAPLLLALFLHTAIDQQVEKEAGLSCKEKSAMEWVEAGKLTEVRYAEIRKNALEAVRGTVQADILKEDQAQNTCIFSTEFALRLMGDIQAYFVEHRIRNYYSVSVSGYHIAEAGANPISQLAFTLANGFTYLEYYLSRGMNVDDFAPNLSFFFSNGLDPEYSVIGRVARRIWAVALRDLYGANERSQKLKYHVQTSGRSLHAQEIQFNDIRTTLQALSAINDNCNSLHTNAYDEAITTPTEASVRRAMAIQLIIQQENGMNKVENPLQGSFIIETLTDQVEEAVLAEFDRINERGGVLGAMETMYQRGKIQEESIYYEHQKHSGTLPIVGVNTFLGTGEDESAHIELMRATDAEKEAQLKRLKAFESRYAQRATEGIQRLQTAAKSQENLFDVLMDIMPFCSIGQITEALFEVGGQYRRNM